MNAHTDLIDRYFDAWNETDGARRREWIAATWPIRTAACRRLLAFSITCRTAPDHGSHFTEAIMHEAAAATAPGTTIGYARLSGVLDALSSAIAGFALLAGARAFMFTALLGWREPVLGGAGLVLLALVGWLRWRCAGAAFPPTVRNIALTIVRRDAACGRRQPPLTEDRNVACYNRSPERDSKRGITLVERQLLWPYSNAGEKRPCGDRFALPGPSVPTRADCRQSDHKETPC